ncbi:peptide ABC transporter substrate-binding protein [Viridibacillus sp. FSL R5-0888]|uniref:peptide ABC transporter substrate-binding protein n=1 Tax=Viridibacillus sp. FSL R5-0888 TaxID=2921663 RepID=UPI0030FB9679
MKNRLKAMLFMLTFLLIACNTDINPKEHASEIYTIALNAIMETDKSLNDDMKFIAIDMSNFDALNEKQKKSILDYFEDKYKVKVMDATFDDLKEKGYYNEDTLDGVLLTVQKVNFNVKNNIFFNGSKYRSAKGAIGVESTVHYKGGTWRIKKIRESWVS